LQEFGKIAELLTAYGPIKSNFPIKYRRMSTESSLINISTCKKEDVLSVKRKE
jgi:hypothetical protein